MESTHGQQLQHNCPRMRGLSRIGQLCENRQDLFLQLSV